MIYDTHIHLNADEYNDNLEELLLNAKSKGVELFNCIGFDIKSSIEAIKIANKYQEVYASVGLIPTEFRQYNGEETISELRKLATSSKKVIAIGEIGLDYYWENSENIKEIQKKMFIEQINLANELNLPISIHARDSLQDVYDILKFHRCNNNGVMHCYSGSLEMAKEFIKLGYKIAFGGVLTFKNSVKTKEVIKGIGLDNIVFETDAPYLTPTPYRGKLNLPEYIKLTVDYASNLLNIDINRLEDITFDTSCKIFHVKKYERNN